MRLGRSCPCSWPRVCAASVLRPLWIRLRGRGFVVCSAGHTGRACTKLDSIGRRQRNKRGLGKRLSPASEPAGARDSASTQAQRDPHCVCLWPHSEVQSWPPSVDRFCFTGTLAALTQPPGSSLSSGRRCERGQHRSTTAGMIRAFSAAGPSSARRLTRAAVASSAVGAAVPVPADGCRP